MIRRLVFILIICLVAFPLFATGIGEEPEAADDTAMMETPSDPRLYEPGKLTVATGEPVFPPWMLDDNPEGGEGFESALVYALADELGFDREDVVWIRQTFDQGIAPGPKPYDFNIQQYSITEDRKEFVTFSDVYYQPDKAVVALPDSGISEARSFADLRDVRWGATIGTTDLDYIEEIIGADDVAVFNDQAATFQALLGDQIDATVISVPTAYFATAVQVPEAEISAILPADPNDQGFGFVFEKDNPLVDWINEGLAALKADGTIDELATIWLASAGEIPEIAE